IDHTGQQDWSFQPRLDVPVVPGDLFELEAWLRLEGDARAELSVVTYDAGGSVLEWLYGRRSSQAPRDWHRLQSRFAVPDGVATPRPRLTGSAPGTVWIDDVSLVKRGNTGDARAAGLPPQLAIRNALLEVTLSTADGTLEVLDARTHQRWAQRAVTLAVAV